MRAFPLGHWLQFSWHAAALGLIALALAVGAAMSLSLRRDELSPRAARLRFEVVGWSAAVAAVLSVCVWPYLTAFAQIRVTPSGHWRLENYLGIAVAELPPRELRSVRGEDLGGRQVGLGHLIVRRADGTALRSVRITATAFTVTCKLLGYAAGDVTDDGGSLTIASHRFSARGPAMQTLASNP